LSNKTEIFTEYPDLVSPSLLSKMLGVCPSTAYRLLKDEKIKSMKIGRKIVVPKESVIGFVESMCYNQSHDEQMRSNGLDLVTKGEER
jgi:hypothetical protein